MKGNPAAVCVFTLLLPFFPLGAEVFSFWPFSGGGTPSVSVADSVLNPEKLSSERVVVNGREAVMSVSLTDADPKSALRSLRLRYPKGSAAMNAHSLLFGTPPENGFRKRILVISFPGIEKRLLFSMNVPENGFGKTPVWPHELPLPAGAEPVSVLRFPDRNSVYGQMRSSMSPGELLSNIAQQLKAEGWLAPGDEAASAHGSGEVFFNADSSEMMIVGILPQKGTRGTTGSIYRRKLK